jgi:hypothetical protein
VEVKISGPRPPSGSPYLKHAENLIPTEVSEAKEEKGKKDDITYAVAGAASTAERRRWRRPSSFCSARRLSPILCNCSGWRPVTDAAN